MPLLKLAILGAGNVAESYIRQIRRLRESGIEVELAALCGRTARPAKTLADRFDIPWHGTDMQAVLGHGEIDAVIILTPMQLHAAHARAALLAGKHVFSEKTLAGTASEGHELAALARSRNLCIAAAPFTTLSPTFQDAHRRINGGEIGTPHACRAFYGWHGPDWSSWFHEQGAGTLRDLGVYALTTLTGLLGPVRTVFALGSMSGEATDITHISLGFANGCTGTLTAGYGIQKYRASGIEIYGSTGTLQFMGQDWDPKGIELWTNDEGCWRQFEADGSWPWTDGLRDFAISIIAQRPPEMQLSLSLHVLEIIDKALASRASGRAVFVESSFDPLTVSAQADRSELHLKHNPLTFT
ncbi:MAG: Gfo/Idh/MocA family oxidoreductase [Proteobacteria bacterium]|nr:Gfo/Idh/MocA family oxidoreductase [Pseudomonadota bacterium]